MCWDPEILVTFVYSVSMTVNPFYNVLRVSKICDVSLNYFPAKYNGKPSTKRSP